MQRGVLMMAMLWAAILVGCNSSSDDTQPKATAAASKSTTQTKPAKVQGPDAAVFDFLEAVRTGNDQKANDMLTRLAREKTAELEMVVAPPGSDTASFKVGDVEMISEGEEQGAHVACTWTDVGEDGQPHTDDIIWMLRQEPEGWRIAGMATKIFEDEPPLLLNFEDPEDMVRKQQMAEDEIQRRSESANPSQDDQASQIQPDDAVRK